MKTAPRKGFTLIELLIVISIIAILSTIGLAVFAGAQRSARTAKRIGDLKSIKTALESYYAENRKYPVGGPWRAANNCGGWIQVAPNDVIPGLVPQYMNSIPTDPSMKNNSTSCYLYYGTETDYKLLDHDVEEYKIDKKIYASQPDLVDPTRDGGSECSKQDYDVNNPGIWAWAIWSKNTGINDSSNPACW